ncbi:MAG: 3-keto-5-aminohexanoate cleavage protein [Candidatus Sericytochromatia bacterium]|nr:3-keto-5-aminohexanoate cleavage protein [Candidatus Sericytochromatia bacterium]
MDKLIITCAPVGAEVMKTDNPAVPYGPVEIARSALAAVEAGASILHLHARTEAGIPTQDSDTFRDIFRRIKAESNPILQISTGGAVTAAPSERLAPLNDPEIVELLEMASFTCGTVNFGDDVFMNTPEFLVSLARKLKETDIKPEIEVFEAGMIANALRLARHGELSHPMHFDFVLGVPGGMPGGMRQLLFLIDSLPALCTWSVAGVGPHQLPLATAAILLGGHVRVGLEDNLYYRKGELAKSNAQLVQRIVRLANELGREVATPDEARDILGLPPTRTKTV